MRGLLANDENPADFRKTGRFWDEGCTLSLFPFLSILALQVRLKRSGIDMWKNTERLYSRQRFMFHGVTFWGILPSLPCSGNIKCRYFHRCLSHIRGMYKFFFDIWYMIHLWYVYILYTVSSHTFRIYWRPISPLLQPSLIITLTRYLNITIHFFGHKTSQCDSELSWLVWVKFYKDDFFLFLMESYDWKNVTHFYGDHHLETSTI